MPINTEKDTSESIHQGVSWGFKPTTELDLVKIISFLKNKNSSGNDLMSNRMLKREKYLFARLLKQLINDSIEIKQI